MNLRNLAIWGVIVAVLVTLYSVMNPSTKSTAGAEITRLWAGVQNLQSNLFRFASSLIFVAGLWLTRRYFLGASWRKMILITTIVMSVIDAPFTFMTIFGVVRNQYFFLGEAFLVSLPRATSFVVSIYVIVPFVVLVRGCCPAYYVPLFQCRAHPPPAARAIDSVAAMCSPQGYFFTSGSVTAYYNNLYQCRVVMRSLAARQEANTYGFCAMIYWQVRPSLNTHA